MITASTLSLPELFLVFCDTRTDISSVTFVFLSSRGTAVTQRRPAVMEAEFTIGVGDTSSQTADTGRSTLIIFQPFDHYVFCPESQTTMNVCVTSLEGQCHLPAVAYPRTAQLSRDDRRIRVSMSVVSQTSPKKKSKSISTLTKSHIISELYHHPTGKQYFMMIMPVP